jgi:tRNA (guanine-N7-)-methyltransferase
MNSVYTICSNQDDIHEKLDQIVHKHMMSDYQLFISQRQNTIFEQAMGLIATKTYTGLIMDSGCGTGTSTRLLAQKFPQHFVIGVDKSSHRLSKHPGITNHKAIHLVADNAMLIQADLITFWYLAAQSGLTFDHHCIYYPNPWPKAKHLKRRFHGHPVFPYLVKICPVLTIRSNWLIYLKEMQHALQICNIPATILTITPTKQPISLFEKKYFQANEPVFELSTNQPHDIKS